MFSYFLFLVCNNRRPATFGRGNAVLGKVDALIAAWRPGEEAGTAILNVLSGGVNPSAKLAQSWPRTAGHVHSGSSPWLQTVRGKWAANHKSEVHEYNATHNSDKVTMNQANWCCLSQVDADGRWYDSYVSSDFADATPLFRFGFGYVR